MMYILIQHEDHLNHWENTYIRIFNDLEKVREVFRDIVNDWLTLRKSDRDPHYEWILKLIEHEDFDPHWEWLNISSDLYECQFVNDYFYYNDNHDSDRFALNIIHHEDKDTNGEEWIDCRV